MENYLGEIRLFAGNFAPVGWLFCDGSLQSIANNDALYSLIGTIYGGDGVNTFGVPDLRGRVPVGQGQGTGLSPYTMGEATGTETVTLIGNPLPPHNHPATAVDGTATTPTPGAGVTFGTVTPNGNTLALYTTQVPPTAPFAVMNASAVGATGGSQPHDNTMPTTTINFIIATSGIYPSRN